MPRRKYKEIGIDDSVFQERVVKLARKFKVDEKQFIKDQSRLLARDAARFTPPFAQFPDWHKGRHVGTKADLEMGEYAVDWDLRRIFAPISDKKAWDEFRKSKGGPVYRYNTIKAPGVITDAFKMHQWHRDHKRRDGRTKKIKNRNGIPWVPESLFYEYVKSQQASVGMAKASFLKASMAFGGKSSATPKIKRHLARTSGSGNLVKTGKGYDGHIRASAEGLYHLIRLLPHLRRNRTKKAEKRLEILAKKAVKSSGFKTR